MRLTFKNFIDQKVDMMFFENMGDLFEKWIQRNSGLIISFLSHFEKLFKILNIKKIFIDNVSKETLWFFNELDMTVDKINFFKYFALFDPINLNKLKFTIFLFLVELKVKVFTISFNSLSPCNLFLSDSC